MSMTWDDDSDHAELLSALVDGELGAGEGASACDAWKANADARLAWHAYHLIGDVLRSDDLASPAGHDRSFLLAVRARLATEPVVLAPSATTMTMPRPPVARSRWMLGSAMAAGFALVAGTFVVLGPNGPSSTMVAQPVAVAAGTAVPVDPTLRQASLDRPVEAGPIMVNDRMLRDARLDRYLMAHKQFAGTSALGVPSAFLRSATVDVEPR